MCPISLDNGILTPEDVAEEFGLCQDKDFVYLMRHGEVIVVFSVFGVAKEAIQEEIARQSLASVV